MSSSDRSQGQYRRMSDGGKSRASTPAGKDGGGDKTHAEDEESIPSRVSSAEVRRRKRAWHFGDIPGVDLEVFREKTDQLAPEDAGLKESDAVSVQLPAISISTAENASSSSSPLLPDQKRTTAAGQASASNVLGARLKRHRTNQHFQLPMSTLSPNDNTDGMPGVVVKVTGSERAKSTFGERLATRNQRLRGPATVSFADVPTVHEDAPWAAHPAAAGMRAEKQDKQRMSYARSRAKQVHSPEFGNAETIHLPPGSQAWSSLQDQGNVDLQLLHVTSRGPTEDMTQRLTGQPATKTGALRKVENERRGKNVFQLARLRLKIWYKNFRQTKEANPFLKKYIKTIQARFGNGTASFFIFSRSILQLNIFIALLWLFFVVIPMLSKTSRSKEPFLLRNLYDGEGAIADSVVFYGGYDSTSLKYPLDVAYLTASLLTIYCSFLIIIHWFAKSLEGSATSKQREAAGISYATTVLTSWEHSASRSVPAVANMRTSIVTSLKELLDERKRIQKARQLSKRERYKQTILRVLAWAVAFILVGGTIGLFVVIEAPVNSNSTNTTNTKLLNGVPEQAYTIIFTLANILIPFLLSKLVLFESYSSEKIETRVTMTRVFIVRIANIYVLIYRSVGDTTSTCPGTGFGQEFYSIALVTTFLSVLYHYLFRYWTNTRLQMNRPFAVLDIVYYQALIWVGTPFCPLLPVIGCFGVMLTFVVYYRIVLDTCQPPERRWTQSLNDPGFIFLLALSSFFVMIPFSLYVSREESSIGWNTTRSECGPYNNTDEPLAVFTNKLSSSSGSDVLTVLLLIASTCFSASVLLPLAVIVIAFSHFQHVSGRREKAEREKLWLEWAEDRQKMSTYMKFVSGCKCRSKERDKLLQGSAGEYFEIFDDNQITSNHGNSTAAAPKKLLKKMTAGLLSLSNRPAVNQAVPLVTVHEDDSATNVTAADDQGITSAV